MLTLIAVGEVYIGILLQEGQGNSFSFRFFKTVSLSLHVVLYLKKIFHRLFEKIYLYLSQYFYTYSKAFGNCFALEERKSSNFRVLPECSFFCFFCYMDVNRSERQVLERELIALDSIGSLRSNFFSHLSTNTFNVLSDLINTSSLKLSILFAFRN